ncbi:MAG: hypothetical protein NVS1B2_16170 [Vulcanimicrobiaceae bacterium]
MSTWAERHNAAMRDPREGFEDALVGALTAWNKYAAAHLARYESPIGEDYVLGPAWIQWGNALRTILNGETGRLDCGSIDSGIYRTAAENGVTATRFDGEEA